jgi:hypothetical protein
MDLWSAAHGKYKHWSDWFIMTFCYSRRSTYGISNGGYFWAPRWAPLGVGLEGQMELGTPPGLSTGGSSRRDKKIILQRCEATLSSVRQTTQTTTILPTKQTPPTLVSIRAVSLLAFARLRIDSSRNEGEAVKAVSQAHGPVLHDLWLPRALPGPR